MIELIDFGKDYGDFTAVECLNLKIDEGEMFGFIGPNGAGKSTSIRFLTTLLKPVAVRGSSTVSASPNRRWTCVAVWAICRIVSACMTG